ncbi:uncharacterized protein DUF3253 [Hoeflea marina]|uniref:Uncharacterized protein DUF3253 n=1 Tax=Hoeflea marina TaxID=274592 RepID=A0A317PQ98_9HYPH|nr:DUF3253 domain-containing protein [Hoeflea marina]PWW03651.1 uncharacterized protein DUF3253 [Hoeflea marina]
MTRPTGHSEADIRMTIVEHLAKAGAGKTISPSDVARAMAGKDEKAWSQVMKPLRRVCIAMAKDGELEIRRKGKVADPDDFRGIYRLAAASPESIARAAQARLDAAGDNPDTDAE